MTVTLATDTDIPDPLEIQRVLTQGTLGDTPDVISIQPIELDPPATMNCRRIGELSANRLLLTHPVRQGLLEPIRVGNSLKLRYFDGLSVVQRDALVEKIFYNPEPFILIKLAKSQANQSKTIRHNRRVACNFEATVHWQANDKHIALMTDVSMGGGMLLLNKPIPKGITQLSINMEVSCDNNSNCIEVNALVRRSTSQLIGNEKVHVMAVQFSDLSPFAKLVLNNYINGMLLMQSHVY